MSDHCIIIVPRVSSYPNKKFKVRDILQWLISKDIVKPVLVDCVLSSNFGYPVSAGARNIVHYPDDLSLHRITNGLEIITEREVFHTGGNGVEEIICSSCKNDLSDKEWDFLSNWYEGADDSIICPSCNAIVSIQSSSFVPEWGFSDLGFKFWNWPDFTNEFLDSFKEKLGCEIAIVYQRV